MITFMYSELRWGIVEGSTLAGMRGSRNLLMTSIMVSNASCWELSVYWRNTIKVCEKLTTKSPIKS